MKTKTTNENLVNNSNHSQNQNLINQIDNLLIERLPDLISDELKWIRKDYGNDELSEFLCGDEYHENSVLLHLMEESINKHLNSKQNMKTKTIYENLVNNSNHSQTEEVDIVEYVIQTIKSEIWEKNKFDFIIDNFSNCIDELGKGEKGIIVEQYCNDGDCEYEDIMDDYLENLNDDDKIEIFERYSYLFEINPFQMYFENKSIDFENMKEKIMLRLSRNK